MEEKEAFLIFNHIKGLDVKKISSLLDHFGSATKILEASLADLCEILDCQETAQRVALWKEADGWKKDLETVFKQGAQVIPFNDLLYPSNLRILSDPPIVLYVSGEIAPDDLKKALGVVGTRQCSNYGTEMARQLSADLAAGGLTIVSGLARGIDTAAHQGALSCGRTIAVLGSGIANLYPRENDGLAQKIKEKGALVSELPMLTPPSKYQFPRRNRLVSALSIGVLLIEAPLKSGAMITMQLAHVQDKRCFALPGRADIDAFRGNHALIKTRKAELVESASDIFTAIPKNLLNLDLSIMKDRQISFDGLALEEKEIFQLLRDGELSIEELVLQTKWPIAKLSSQLMKLVLKEKIQELPGKLYKLSKGAS
ncbi:MAG: DNA-processing protein DprA [Anaerolineae bacterium]